MELSSEVSMCLEPLTARGKWQWEAGCLLKSHCIDVSGARGGCLEVSHFFFFLLYALVRLNFHVEMMVPEQLKALA